MSLLDECAHWYREMILKWNAKKCDIGRKSNVMTPAIFMFDDDQIKKGLHTIIETHAQLKTE